MELEENQIVGMVIQVLKVDDIALKIEEDGTTTNITMMGMTTGMMTLGMNGITEEIDDHTEKSIMIDQDITGRIWRKKNLLSSSKLCINPYSRSLNLKRKSHKATST